MNAQEDSANVAHDMGHNPMELGKAEDLVENFRSIANVKNTRTKLVQLALRDQMDPKSKVLTAKEDLEDIMFLYKFLEDAE